MLKKIFSAGQLKLLPWIILIIAAVWNFAGIFQLALDVPVEDDWDHLALSSEPENIFAVHVQHRIIFTRTILYLCREMDMLNFRWLITGSWFIYLAMTASVMLVCRKTLAKHPFAVCLFLPFFSDAAQTNLLWVGQNQFHFMLLFSMLAIHFGYTRRDHWHDRILMIGCLAAASFAMSPLFPALILGCRGIRQGLFIMRTKDILRRKKLLISESAVIITGAAVIGSFFINYTPAKLSHAALPDFVFFTAVNFIKSFGLFTSETPKPMIALITLLMIIPGCALLRILWLKKLKLFITDWQAVTLLLWTALFSAAIAWGRNGIMDWRHTEAVLPAIPALGILLIHYAPRKKFPLALTSFTVMLIAALSISCSFAHSKIKFEERRTGLQKLRQWVADDAGEPDIPELYPWPGFKEKIVAAEPLTLHCLRDIPEKK